MSMSEKKYGFEPVYNTDSRLLILGSFPSVKSRKVEFYYGNKQNRFWKMICEFFREQVPEQTERKKDFLLRRNIALWDIVTECEVEGSKDASIRNYRVAELEKVLQNSRICFIILNGSKAYEIFLKHYGNIAVPYRKLSSTSPANTRFDREEWYNVLSGIFERVE